MSENMPNKKGGITTTKGEEMRDNYIKEIEASLERPLDDGEKLLFCSGFRLGMTSSLKLTPPKIMEFAIATQPKD